MVGFQVLMAVSCDVASCLVDTDRRFRGVCFFYHYGDESTQTIEAVSFSETSVSIY
jgi:hypothetical protein